MVLLSQTVVVIYQIWRFAVVVVVACILHSAASLQQTPTQLRKYLVLCSNLIVSFLLCARVRGCFVLNLILLSHRRPNYRLAQSGWPADHRLTRWRNTVAKLGSSGECVSESVSRLILRKRKRVTYTRQWKWQSRNNEERRLLKTVRWWWL
jgi:hypothetical protein